MLAGPMGTQPFAARLLETPPQSAASRHGESHPMIVPRFPVGLIATSSLVLISIPGHACEKIAGSGSAGSPCAGLTVAQDRDLAFSIQSTGCAQRSPAPIGLPGKRPAVAIGHGLKADAAIFSRLSAERKEVSDASPR